MPGDAVVSVSGTAITKATFNHWMKVAAASSTDAGDPQAPVMPEPPKYTACIAHLAATAPKPAKGQKAPTTAKLKSECEDAVQSAAARGAGLPDLLAWVLGEASSLGVKHQRLEVHKEFEKIKTEQFPKAAEFEKFLASSGQTVSDLLLRVKLNLLSQKIQTEDRQADKSKVTEAQIDQVLQGKQVPVRHA